MPPKMKEYKLLVMSSIFGAVEKMYIIQLGIVKRGSKRGLKRGNLFFQILQHEKITCEM